MKKSLLILVFTLFIYSASFSQNLHLGISMSQTKLGLEFFPAYGGFAQYNVKLREKISIIPRMGLFQGSHTYYIYDPVPGEEAHADALSAYIDTDLALKIIPSLQVGELRFTIGPSIRYLRANYVWAASKNVTTGQDFKTWHKDEEGFNYGVSVGLQYHLAVYKNYSLGVRAEYKIYKEPHIPMLSVLFGF
jgi:hypothetical protein